MNAMKRNGIPNILVVEDNSDHAFLVGKSLAALGVHVEFARHGADALALAAKNDFDVIIVDYRLPDWEGTNLCRQLRKNGVKAKLIVVTAISSEWVASRAFEADADDFVVKASDYPQRIADAVAAMIGET